MGPLAALAAAAAAAGYVLGVRPRLLRWGATAQEAAGPLPGDELVPAPRMQSTRAVSIAAPPAVVWPWLVQLGSGRGGMYSYDILENAVGLKMHSADRILPEFQRLDVGDTIPLSPGGGVPVRRLEPEAVLALGGPLDPRTGQVTARIAGDGPRTAGPRLEVGWTFVLQPLGARSTRLISRTRYNYAPLPLGIPLRVVLEPLQFLMERRMLLGIRSRVERRHPRSRRPRGRQASPAGRRRVKSARASIIAGVVLMAVGLLLLLDRLGIVESVAYLPALIFAAVGVVFLSLFIRSRVNWWAAIPGSVFLGLAAVITATQFMDGSAGAAFLFLFMAAGFAAVYLRERANWWALIPAGVMLTLAAVVALPQDLQGPPVPAVLFLGLAATFGLVSLVPVRTAGPPARMNWPLVPAAVLAVLGAIFAFQALALLVVADFAVPAVMILAGLALLVYAYRSRRNGHKAHGA